MTSLVITTAGGVNKIDGELFARLTEDEPSGETSDPNAYGMVVTLLARLAVEMARAEDDHA